MSNAAKAVGIFIFCFSCCSSIAAPVTSDNGHPVTADGFGITYFAGPVEKWNCSGGGMSGSWGILGHDLVAPPSDISGIRVHYPIVKDNDDALIAMSEIHPEDRQFEMVIIDKKSLHIKFLGILLASDYQDKDSGICKINPVPN